MVAFDTAWDDSSIQSVIDLRSSEAIAEIRSAVHGAKVRNGKIMARLIRGAKRRRTAQSPVSRAFSDAINKAYRDAAWVMSTTSFERIRGEGMTNVGRVRFVGEG